MIADRVLAKWQSWFKCPLKLFERINKLYRPLNKCQDFDYHLLLSPYR